MPSKKPTKKAKKVHNISGSKNSNKTPRVHVAFTIKELNKDSFKDGDDFLGPYPIRRNPAPPPEETEKKLAARKALTLRAFQMAYENHHRRKAS
ncbi:MAG: hypothetical protein H0T60_17780 [Acidobacteria bacterium]|nr:hypothetical protein [Acidobacteriota bacterium]